MIKRPRRNFVVRLSTLGIAAALLGTRAEIVVAQVSDSAAHARGDSMSVCPAVFHRGEEPPYGDSFEISPFSLHSSTAFINIGFSAVYPAGSRPIVVALAMAITHGKPRYAAAHDMSITGDDKTKLHPVSEYSDGAPQADNHFETVRFKMPLKDFQRLSGATHITLSVGPDVFTLGKGQVQAIQTFLDARPGSSALGEIPTGCVRPFQSPLETRSTNGHDVLFEFQVDRPARQIGGGLLLYPPQLKAANVEGSVLAQFVVSEDGTADTNTFKIVRSSNELFSTAVRNVMPQLRFEPAEVKGKKVKQLVQLPFDFKTTKPSTDSITVGASALPISSSQQVYTASEVDRQVRNLNGSAVTNTLAPEVVAYFGSDALLEFVVNADGSIEPSTMKVLRAPSAELGVAIAKGAVRIRFLAAELGGKRVRQIVQLDTPVQIQRSR